MAMIADVDVTVARVAANHEKMKLSQQKHLKMILNFDVLLKDKKNADAERVLTRQSRTDKLILPASLVKLFSETLTKHLKASL